MTKKKRLSQEWLKIIACITMLIDHVGAAIIIEWYLDARIVNGADTLSMGLSEEAESLYRLYRLLRIVGRLAFPIYCFMLAEGLAHTRSYRGYGMRLLVGMLLAEIPFDLLFYGGITWNHQNVMVTLMLGFLFGMATNRIRSLPLRAVLAVPFCMLGELCRSDYGGWGVAMVALFILTRELSAGKGIQTVGLAAINWGIDGFGFGAASVQMYALLALIPIHFYSGRKSTGNKWIQWAFYLFYPAHLLVLYIIKERL